MSSHAASYGEKQIGRAYGAPRQPSTLPGRIGPLISQHHFFNSTRTEEHDKPGFCGS